MANDDEQRNVLIYHNGERYRVDPPVLRVRFGVRTEIRFHSFLDVPATVLLEAVPLDRPRDRLGIGPQEAVPVYISRDGEMRGVYPYRVQIADDYAAAHSDPVIIIYDDGAF